MICGIDLVLKERILEAVAHQRHGPVDAGVDGRGEEGGRDGDPHTSSLVASEDSEGDPDPAGDGNEDSDHQTAPASPAQHLSGRPVGGGDSKQVARPVELQDEDATKQEATQDTDTQGVQLSLQPSPHQLLVLDGSTKDYGQYGTHQGRD